MICLHLSLSFSCLCLSREMWKSICQHRFFRFCQANIPLSHLEILELPSAIIDWFELSSSSATPNQWDAAADCFCLLLLLRLMGSCRTSQPLCFVFFVQAVTLTLYPSRCSCEWGKNPCSLLLCFSRSSHNNPGGLYFFVSVMHYLTIHLINLKICSTKH